MPGHGIATPQQIDQPFAEQGGLLPGIPLHCGGQQQYQLAMFGQQGGDHAGGQAVAGNGDVETGDIHRSKAESSSSLCTVSPASSRMAVVTPVPATMVSPR